MPIHPEFPKSPFVILDPQVRWIPKDEQSRKNLTSPLVNNLRILVKGFRDNGYDKASDTSKSLLNWWFRRDRDELQTDGDLFNYYFAQREAVETIIYLIDVVGANDQFDLMRLAGGSSLSGELFPENWRRYAIKMATGSGKTKVASLLLAWSYFHKKYETDSPMARNFLIIAPNIIVLDRLAKDFNGLKIFNQDRVVPDNGYEGRDWQNDFQLTLHRQDEVNITNETGNIFLSNIHRVYDSKKTKASAKDTDCSDFFLGEKPSKSTATSSVDLGDIVRNINELVIINDEAHHVHDDRLAWFKSIEEINDRLVLKGSKLSLQLDMTATPKHTNGSLFAQTVSDYPLVEAIAQDIVKHPVIPDDASQSRLTEKKLKNFVGKYSDYIKLGVIEWNKTFKELSPTGRKPILFVMVDDTKNCDEVAEYLKTAFREFSDDNSVLTIHTKKNGDISEASSPRAQRELDELRKLATEIDKPQSPYKAIVSVLMLKEGWDVRNVTTIVGLRAYSAKSNILPEQTLGRGLRKMNPVWSNNSEEYVSVIGTPAFMEFVESINSEGVEFLRSPMGSTANSIQPMLVRVEDDNPEKDLEKLEIEIPLLGPIYYKKYENINNLDVSKLISKPLELKRYDSQGSNPIVFEYTVIRENEDSHHK